MMHIKTYESHSNSILLIVDVQRSFRSFFSEMYINELKKYCKKFQTVYQIFDNHVDGKNVDSDYLYKKNPDVPIHDDLYHFPNQKDIIEKRYNYNVDVDFYKKILDKITYDELKIKESNKSLKNGDIFKTKEGSFIVYVGNTHRWFHLTKKLHDLFYKLRGKEIVMVGGSLSECFLDVETAAKSMGVIVKVNYKYTYSANHCYL